MKQFVLLVETSDESDDAYYIIAAFENFSELETFLTTYGDKGKLQYLRWQYWDLQQDKLKPVQTDEVIRSVTTTYTYTIKKRSAEEASYLHGTEF